MTRMPNLNFPQQDDLFHSSYARPVTLIGAGSVGSQIARMLAKIGVRDLTVYDEDTIESHNIPPSAYQIADLGMTKVEALRTLLEKESGLALKPIPRMYEGERLTSSVIASVDTMEARQCIWNEVKGNPLVDIYIDTRLSAELISVFAISPCNSEDIAYYEHFLYPTSETLRPLCGEHTIVYVSSAAAVFACANLTSWWQFGRKKLHCKMLVGALEMC